MKKRIVVLSSAFVAALIIGLTGCSKDDTTAPVVTLSGNSTVDVILNDTYTEDGATANDDEDGAITVTQSGAVDVDHTGTYTLTYSATDEAGNVGSATRVVNVYNQAENFGGAYANCVDICVVTPTSNFSSTVTVSEHVNKEVAISNFGAFGSAVSVTAMITDDAASSPINIATGQVLGGNAVIQTVYQADTKVISGAASSTSFQVKYQWSDGTDSDVCTSTYAR